MRRPFRNRGPGTSGPPGAWPVPRPHFPEDSRTSAPVLPSGQLGRRVLWDSLPVLPAGGAQHQHSTEQLGQSAIWGGGLANRAEEITPDVTQVKPNPRGRSPGRPSRGGQSHRSHPSPAAPDRVRADAEGEQSPLPRNRGRVTRPRDRWRQLGPGTAHLRQGGTTPVPTSCAAERLHCGREVGTHELLDVGAVAAVDGIGAIKQDREGEVRADAGLAWCG